MSTFQESFLEPDLELEEYEDEEMLGIDPELDLEWDELDLSHQELEAEAEIGRRSRMPFRPAPRSPRSRPMPQRSLRPRPQSAARRNPQHRLKPRRVIRHPRSVLTHEPVTCICPERTCPQHGTEYIRWVQNALNDVLGLRLPVNGIMGRETRSAVRSFQEREGLPVTGIVGPDIERALLAARGGKSPGAEATRPAATGMPEPAATQPEPGIAEPAEPAATSPAAEFDFEFERPEARMEVADERRRKAMAKRLQGTPVGRALAKMGATITIEKAPPLYPAHFVRGRSGFEVHCGRQRNINVVFGLFDEKTKRLAWYLFSSTVDSTSKLACKRSGSRPVVKPFGIFSGAGTITPDLWNSPIDVSELVRDAKSPFATMTLDTKTDKNRITCRLDNLNTKSNGLVNLTFGLRKVSEPSRANVAIPGKLFFLDVEPYDMGKFSDADAPVTDPRRILGPQAIAERKAISNF